MIKAVAAGIEHWVNPQDGSITVDGTVYELGDILWSVHYVHMRDELGPAHPAVATLAVHYQEGENNSASDTASNAAGTILGAISGRIRSLSNVGSMVGDAAQSGRDAVDRFGTATGIVAGIVTLTGLSAAAVSIGLQGAVGGGLLYGLARSGILGSAAQSTAKGAVKAITKVGK